MLSPSELTPSTSTNTESRFRTRRRTITVGEGDAMPGRVCDLCGLDCGKRPISQRVADHERSFCCIGCVNVYVILSESGVLATGTDLRETELFKRSLEMGLISQ